MMGSLTVKAILCLLPLNTLDMLYTSVTVEGSGGYSAVVSVFGEQVHAQLEQSVWVVCVHTLSCHVVQ